MSTQRFTVICGNVVDGFEAHGVFETQDDAIIWADKGGYVEDAPWHVMPINYFMEAGSVRAQMLEALREAEPHIRGQGSARALESVRSAIAAAEGTS